MKKFLLRALPATALSALLLASAAWSMGPHGRDIDHDRMLARMSEHLQLTESQENEIQGILNENSQQMDTDRARLQEIRDAMRLQRESFDAGTTQSLADELGEITARMAYTATSKHARVYQVLDEEQRAEMLEIRAKREARMQKRFSRKQD